MVHRLRLRLLNRSIRITVAGLAVGLGLTLLAPTAANASPLELPTATAVSATAVSGQPWSAPAYPVACQEADEQVTCTPTDPALVKPQQCFINVLLHGDRVTVCTTFEGHTTAIRTSGGKPLEVSYGCSLGDVVCVTFENAGRGMALAATGMMYTIAANTRFDTSSVLWSAAVDEWSFWQWAVLVVLFAAVVWAIAAAVISGDRAELVGAVVRCFIAIPAVGATVWLTGLLLNSIDQMTWYLIGRGSPATLFATLQGVMWAGGQANYFFAFVIDALLMLSMVLLMLVFTFRNIVLAALLAVGPIAWMLFPLRSVGPQWVVRYISSLVVLLLTGPLTIGFVSLIIRGLAAVKTIWDPASWPMLFGLVLVAFAPFAVFGLFSFIGAVAADNVGSRIGSHAGRMGTGAARTAVHIPTRLGGLPAGRTPRGATSPSPSKTGGGSPKPQGASAPAGAPRTDRQSSAPTQPSSAPPTTSSSPTTSATAAAAPAAPKGRSSA